MRRERASKRGRWLSLLVAGVIGFLVGDWHATTLRRPALLPSQNIALRFPEAKADAAVADTASDLPTGTASVLVLGDAQLALLSPNPMVPPPAPVPQAVPQAPAQAAVPAAIAAPAVMPPPRPAPSARRLRSEQQSAADSASRHANRPGYMLNDAQIASIKARLHLTPDQERMWPAVEVALRNVAYAKERQAHRRAAPGAAEVASLDPDSAAVEGLKSAAVPLIMSFSDQQKNEVRSLAHVMGLDKLASEL